MECAPLRAAIITTVLLLVIAVSAAEQNAAAQSLQPPTQLENAGPARQPAADKSGAAGAPCLFDAGRGPVPDCVRAGVTGDLFVASQYLKELSFDAHGLAPVYSQKNGGWMYVNRGGKVVISGVPGMDNWADDFHDGLVRILRNEKYGFANRRGRVVVQPIYDGAMNFEKGRAVVCNGCKSKCVGADSGLARHDCEHHVFAGGEWFQIDAKGTVLTPLHPPPAKKP
jgi:hypothetical protein